MLTVRYCRKFGLFQDLFSLTVTVACVCRNSTEPMQAVHERASSDAGHSRGAAVCVPFTTLVLSQKVVHGARSPGKTGNKAAWIVCSIELVAHLIYQGPQYDATFSSFCQLFFYGRCKMYMGDIAIIFTCHGPSHSHIPGFLELVFHK